MAIISFEKWCYEENSGSFTNTSALLEEQKRIRLLEIEQEYLIMPFTF